MSQPIPAGLEKILFTEEEIAQRIREVAAEITRAYAGRTVKLIGVLKGSVFFLTELARHIEVPVKIDFLAISSFSNKNGAPGVVRIAKDLDDGIEGDDVMLVEDVIDTGLTLRYLLQTLASRAPNSLAVCTFLDRTSRRIAQAAGGLPLLRDPRPVRSGVRPRLQPAIPQFELCGGLEGGGESYDAETPVTATTRAGATRERS